MFVALRHMMEQLPSGQVVNLTPGDVVQTFSDWPYQNKVAALNNRMVAKAEGNGPVSVDALLAEPADPLVKAAVDLEHGWGPRFRMPLLPPDRQPPTAPTAPEAAPVAAQPPVAQDAADALLAQEDPELAAALGLSVKHACTECDFVSTGAQGLKIHKARVHKAE